jgi:hypothetical protein
MTMSLSVRDVIRSPHAFQRGKHSLAVMGLLVCQQGDCRIIDDNGAVNDLGRAIAGQCWQPRADGCPPDPAVDVSIRIDDATFLPRLLSEIPPVAAAEYLYFDTAMVCGNTRLDLREVVLYNIWDVLLVRDGQRLRALGERRLG